MSRAGILRQFGPQGLTEMVPAYGKPGAITDDTQMTLFTAEGVLGAHVRGVLRGICHPPGVIHYAYLRWLYTQREPLPMANDFLLAGWLIKQKELFARRAPGSTCIGSLRRNSEIGMPAENDSKGCGGVMRRHSGAAIHLAAPPISSLRVCAVKLEYDIGRSI
jgi:ADP-ribosylglycohydrolase